MELKYEFKKKKSDVKFLPIKKQFVYIFFKMDDGGNQISMVFQFLACI